MASSDLNLCRWTFDSRKWKLTFWALNIGTVQRRVVVNFLHNFPSLPLCLSGATTMQGHPPASVCSPPRTMRQTLIAIVTIYRLDHHSMHALRAIRMSRYYIFPVHFFFLFIRFPQDSISNCFAVSRDALDARTHTHTHTKCIIFSVHVHTNSLIHLAYQRSSSRVFVYICYPITYEQHVYMAACTHRLYCILCCI